MKARQHVWTWLCAVLICGLAATAAGQPNWNYDFTGYSAPSADLETLLGPTVGGPLDAKAYGYPGFGVPPDDPLRNLNVISQVFQADQEVAIGIGENATEIVLHPGDYTFAYTLDYTGQTGGADQPSIMSFQLYRVIVDEVFAPLEGNPPIYNPGPFMALDQVKAAAYNTAPEFHGGAFQPYPEGVTGEEISDYYGPPFDGWFQTSEVEFKWPVDGLIEHGDKAMVFLFTGPDVEIRQIGWNPDDGYTGEGGNVYGTDVEGIPILVPLPEPGSLLFLALGAVLLGRRRRGCR